MQLTLNPLESTKKYYAYTVLTQSNQVIFINYDKLCNIVSFKQLLTNPDFDINAVYKVDIYTPHNNIIAAMNEAATLTRLLCKDTAPRLNLSQRQNRVLPVLCDQTGVKYRNASEACQSLNIPPSRMSMHLSRKPGNKTIRGLSFRYVNNATLINKVDSTVK